MITIPEQIEYIDISKTEDLLMELATDVQFSFKYLGRSLELTIPKGFTTDFGSVPQIVRPIISNTGKYNESYLLHDYCYSKDYVGPEVSKEDADTLLWLNLLDAGMNELKADLVYDAVKLFGESHWRKDEDTDNKN